LREGANQAELPEVVSELATALAKDGQYTQAKVLYQQVLQQYPNSPAADGARLRFSRCTVLELLVAGNDVAAQSEIAAAKANFANHVDFPWVLYSCTVQIH